MTVRLRQRKAKCHSRVPVEIGVVRKQVQAGTLESFHLKENVKYPVKRFNNAKDCKAPDLLHPARALTKLESQSN